MHDALVELGWNAHWQALMAAHAAAGAVPGRVLRSDRGSALVGLSRGVARAALAARLIKAASTPGDLPVAGDWVAVIDAETMEVPLIEAVLPRTSAISRGDPDQRSGAQILAANVDTVFVVHPIAGPPNLRRIERELTLAWNSGAVPVVVLTKVDLSADPEGAAAAVGAIAVGVDVLLVNALSDDSVAQLLTYLRNQRSAVLLGPSGAGKSTLVNTLLGEHRQATQEVRLSDQRGRHTTVTRELIMLPGGGLLIDSPGLRSLGLTGSEQGIATTFSEIEELASGCQFRDCAHHDEPQCAVLAAVDAGVLSAERLASYQKLLREAEVAAARTDVRLRGEEKRRAKILGRAIKDYKRDHPQ